MNAETIDLHAVRHGDASQWPLVVLHGLLGSGRNWTSMTKRLASHFCVWTVDLRNHGASPHSPEMNYSAMVRDLLAFFDREGLRRPVVVGHSMGGKAAMRLAVEQPQRIRGLVVVDIAPKQYPPRWDQEFAALRTLDLASLRSRAEAEERLEADIPDWAFRKFLTTNLIRDPSTGAFRWSVNLQGLQKALPNLFQKGLAADERSEGPALFVRGERSRFVEAADITVIRQHFPQAILKTIDGAGHNVHFDAPDAFAKTLLQWVETF